MRTPDNHERQDDAELQAPPELVSALKRLPQNRPFVPPAVDKAVFRAAQRHLRKGQSERPEVDTRELTRDSLRRLLKLMPWPAAAIALVMLALLTYHFLPSGSRSARRANHGKLVDLARNKPVTEGASSGRTPAPVADNNLSQDARMDILDALILAKRLQSGPVRERRWDVNGDGVVDERDVQTIAVQVVRLDKGGSS